MYTPYIYMTKYDQIKNLLAKIQSTTVEWWNNQPRSATNVCADGPY